MLELMETQLQWCSQNSSRHTYCGEDRQWCRDEQPNQTTTGQINTCSVLPGSQSACQGRLSCRSWTRHTVVRQISGMSYAAAFMQNKHSHFWWSFCKGHLVRTVTFCWQSSLFNHQASTSQLATWLIAPPLPHRQTSHFTAAPQTAGIYSWWACSAGVARLMYVESHSHAFSRGNFSGTAQLGFPQPRYCFGKWKAAVVVVVQSEGGSRRSVTPYTTQLENDALWQNWLNVRTHKRTQELRPGPPDPSHQRFQKHAAPTLMCLLSAMSLFVFFTLSYQYLFMSKMNRNSFTLSQCLLRDTICHTVSIGNGIFSLFVTVETFIFNSKILHFLLGRKWKCEVCLSTSV